MQYKVDFDPPLECPISRVIVCVPSKGQRKDWRQRASKEFPVTRKKAVDLSCT